MTDYDMMSEWDLDRDLPRRRPEDARPRNNYASSRGYADPRNTRMPDVRRRRKRRARIRRMILLIILLLVVLAAIGAGVYFFVNKVSTGKSDKAVVYTREIDITDAVVGEAAVWLSSVDGNVIDTQWVKERCGKFMVTAKLTLGKDEEGNKTFDEKVDEASYNTFTANVDAALNSMLSEIIAEQLVKSGYAESVTPEEAMNIAVQVLGMGIPDYIRENGVSIVPSIEDINSAYTLTGGTYSISHGEMVMNSSSGESHTEPYISKKDSLILVNSGTVYTKEEDDNE